IGAVEDLPGAVHIGPVSDQQNMEKLRQILANLPKNKAVVIYCGCCPFTKCPNIQPAYRELKKNGFTQIKVLDLPTNLKTNWIAKGYPLEKK
ncbi:MAG: rhodanese-like domain-containing protein, partial [Mucilaginibacter sp.]